ncbi:glycosyltransferase family 4 protein [Marinobacterium mangrovicola]|uniref:Glycosyltransferase involved in cell wall biosynthesis n=1 Tax=Marinobacterium mangrovicola TaxID=1476959 RepID=A0A4R1H7P8_9GAMM|nr:glycosyltransferase family 4 protein [Marinobacterium mangrovicola]TCK16491.1 glycosyltransferase involved in cell wall biosynthesis [Marinobacterium mangrovicola]
MQREGKGAKSLRVVQVLPALDSGGVERGTVEFAKELVKQGHESIVISSGGRQVATLEAEGSRHISMAVHRKSLRSLALVRPMRRLLTELKPDIIHVRSRAPAWIAWLAWRKLPVNDRPRFVSTVHGMYSVNAYSAVMTKAEHIIAISDCVHDYITQNYGIDARRITRIYRGLDPSVFNASVDLGQWQETLFQEYPQLQGKRLLLMPGRLSRWKGQEAFLDVMRHLSDLRTDCHGVVVGGAEDNKQHYLQELLDKRKELGLDDKVTFVGHRSDIQSFYSLADITCHLSNKAEPFGRTVPEALACGCPVIAYDRGGAAESLHQAFPEGLVEADNPKAFAQRAHELLQRDTIDIHLPEEFYLQHQADATLEVYRRLLASPPG